MEPVVEKPVAGTGTGLSFRPVFYHFLIFRLTNINKRYVIHILKSEKTVRSKKVKKRKKVSKKEGITCLRTKTEREGKREGKKKEREGKRKELAIEGERE